MFPRLDEETVLANDLRFRIYDLVCQDPGVTISDLARLVGVEYKTVEHHVRVLQKVHLVETRRLERTVHAFQNGGTYDRDEQDRLALVRSPTRRRLLALVRTRPGIKVAEAARLLGMSRSTVHFHLARLRERGLASRPIDVCDARSARSRTSKRPAAPGLLSPPLPNLGAVGHSFRVLAPRSMAVEDEKVFEERGGWVR